MTLLTADGRVDVRCFPSSDQAFALFVQQMLEELRVGTEGSTLDAVESRLRRDYPSAAVHARDPFAQVGTDAETTWYVFRDGRYTAESMP